MIPIRTPDAHRLLDPCEASEAEAAQIRHELRQYECSLRAAHAADRREAVSILRFVRWPLRVLVGMVCAPWRLVHALRMPPDQC